ncbi:MAG: hypothetical protein J7647_32795 [Cyanobacteria bacterium SBLK]|nr:hypothetical protein [Cyanobacteria bacterium SBLK]
MKNELKFKQGDTICVKNSFAIPRQIEGGARLADICCNSGDVLKVQQIVPPKTDYNQSDKT